MILPPVSFRRKICLLILLGFLAFLNSVPYPFIHDDFVLILGNPDIERFDHLGAVFFQTVQGKSFQIVNSYYRPLLEIFYRLEYFFSGTHPAGYHLVNIVFHIGNGILAFLFFRKLFQKELLAFTAALFFLIHPVQSEAVASIAGISNILMMFFCLGSLLLYLKAREGRPFFYILSTVLYLAALFVKEQVIILPLLILQIEMFFPRDGKQRIHRCAYYILPALFYVLWRRLILGGGLLTEIFQYPHELWLRLTHIPTALVTYLRILVFPRGLHYYRSLDILAPAAGAWLILAVLTVFYIFCVAKSPKEDRVYHVWGSLWFITALLPVLNFLPLIHEYSLIAAFEHFLYFPLMGFLVTAAVFIRRVLSKFDNALRMKLLQSGITLLIAASLVLTFYQNHFWSSETALFRRTVHYQPEFGRARLLLGKAEFKAGRLKEAAAAFEKALRIMRNYAVKSKGTKAQEIYQGYIVETRMNLARVYQRMGEHHKAIAHLKAASASGGAGVYFPNRIGLHYLQLHQIDEAVKYFQQARDRDPGNVFALSNLAVCYIEKGEFAKARRHLEKVLEIQPDFVPAMRNLETLERYSHNEE